MKKMLAMVLTCGMILTLSGCSGSNSTAASTTAAPAAAVPAGAQSSSSGENTNADTTADFQGDIHYVSMWNETEPQADVIKSAIKDFTAAHPGVKITVDWMGRDTLKTIKATLDAGQVDIWDQSIDHVIVDYNDYGYEMTDLFAKPNPVLDGKTYNDVANPALIKSIAQFAPDGKLHGVPYTPTLVAVYYNKDLFKKAGITAEPKTWTELMDVCQKLKDAGITAFSIDDGYVILPFAMYLGHLKGADFNKNLVRNSGAWDDPAVKQAAEAMQELWDKGYMSKNAASNKYPAGQNEVATGDAAMYLVGSYMLNEVAAIAGDDFHWGTFAFPVPDGSVLPATANTIGMEIMQIAKNSKNPELDFNFITFLTTGKYDAMMSKECNSVPNAVDTQWPPLLSSIQPVLNGTTENVVFGFNINTNADFTPIYKEQAQKLLGGQTDAAGFIAACKAAAAANTK